MNRKEIIEVLKRYRLDINEYIIISGAAMVLYGIKEETSDIDISVTKDYEKLLLSTYNCELEKVNSNGTKAYLIDNIINFGIEYYSSKKEYVEGFPVQTIDEIIELKKRLNREKDKKDLKLIYGFHK